MGEIKNYIFENESIVKQSKSSEFKKISYIKRLIKFFKRISEQELKILSLELGISCKKILEVFKTIYFKDVSWDPVKDEDDLWNTIVTIHSMILKNLISQRCGKKIKKYC